MINQELKSKIEQLAPQALIEEKQYLTITVAKEEFFGLAKKIKEDKQLSFDFLFNITGVDYGTELGASYFLTSTEFKHTIILKTSTADRVNTQLDSVCSLWKAADFHEREIYDLMGIKFKNHPDMRRIFLEETWEGHPLRKDYKDEINIIERN